MQISVRPAKCQVTTPVPAGHKQLHTSLSSSHSTCHPPGPMAVAFHRSSHLLVAVCPPESSRVSSKSLRTTDTTTAGYESNIDISITITNVLALALYPEGSEELLACRRHRCKTVQCVCMSSDRRPKSPWGDVRVSSRSKSRSGSNAGS